MSGEAVIVALEELGRGLDADPADHAFAPLRRLSESAQRLVRVRRTSAAGIAERLWLTDGREAIGLSGPPGAVEVTPSVPVAEVTAILAADVGSVDGPAEIVRVGADALCRRWREPASGDDALDAAERLELIVVEPPLATGDNAEVVASVLFVGPPGRRTLVAPDAFPDSDDLALGRFPDGEAEALLIELFAGAPLCASAARYRAASARVAGALRGLARAGGGAPEADARPAGDAASTDTVSAELDDDAWRRLCEAEGEARDELSVAARIWAAPAVEVLLTTVDRDGGSLTRRRREIRLTDVGLVEVEPAVDKRVRVTLQPIRSLAAWLVAAVRVRPGLALAAPAAAQHAAPEVEAVLASAAFGVDVAVVDRRVPEGATERSLSFVATEAGELHTLDLERQGRHAAERVEPAALVASIVELILAPAALERS